VDALGHHLDEPQPVAPSHEPGQLLPPPDADPGQGGGVRAGVIRRTRRRHRSCRRRPCRRRRRGGRRARGGPAGPGPSRRRPPQDPGAEQRGGHAELGRGGPDRRPAGLGPEPSQGAPAQRGGVGHPQGGHHGHGHGDGQQGDQEADRAPVGRPGGRPGHPQHHQGREPQPGGPVPGPLLGGGGQAAQAQPLPDRGHRRLAPERRLHLGQRPVRLGGDELVGGPLDRVGPGRRAAPIPSRTRRPPRLVLVRTPSRSRLVTAVVATRALPPLRKAASYGSRRAGTAAPGGPASARRLARTTTGTVTANRAR
jgi:hypothetical protein